MGIRGSRVTHVWEGLGAEFTGMRNTKIHKTGWTRFLEDFQAGKSAGKMAA